MEAELLKYKGDPPSVAGAGSGLYVARNVAVVAIVHDVVRREQRSVAVSVVAATGIQRVILVVCQVVVKRALAELIGPAILAGLGLREAQNSKARWRIRCRP